MIVPATVLLAGLASAGPAATEVKVNWGKCPLSRATAASVLVAADPEWTPGGVLSRTSVEGIRSLSEAGADNLRLLNFNIFREGALQPALFLTVPLIATFFLLLDHI